MASSNEEKATRTVRITPEPAYGMTEQKLKNLPDRTVIRFGMKFAPRSRSRLYSYAAIRIDQRWFTTGDPGTAMYTDELGRWIDQNGVGDIEFFLPVKGVTGVS